MVYFYTILAYNMSLYRLCESDNANMKLSTTLSAQGWITRQDDKI